MKILRLFLIVLICNLFGVSAQKTKGILVFKNGEQKTGYAKLAKNNLVRFKSNKKAKAIEYKLSELKHVQIEQNKEYKTYQLVSIKSKDKPKVLELVEKGKVTLYTETNQSHRPVYTGNTGANGQVYMGGNFISIKNLYVLRENENVASHLGSDELFSKNFKQAASNFFQDCSKLVKKIQNREFKKKEIKAIVKYYNSNCN
jgi:hypothetical protein